MFFVLTIYLQLFRLFRKYAKKHPQLGMTPEELKEFLITKCYVSHEIAEGISLLCACHFRPKLYALLVIFDSVRSQSSQELIVLAFI